MHANIINVNTQMTTLRTGVATAATLAKNKGLRQQQQVVMQAQGKHSSNTNLVTVMKQLQLDYGNYKYTVYRCASKFVALQKILHTNNIPYKLVLAILERHGMSASSTSLNLMVPPFQLTSLLHDIYFACEKLGHFTKVNNYQLEAASTMLANFFWNIYDAERRHSISLLEIKTTFLLLCKLYSSEQLVADFYAMLADAKSQHVTPFIFEMLLHTLSKLLSYLGEAKAYGLFNVPQMMEQCFARCHNTAGLSEYQFHNLWTQTQTRFLIFANLLALIKRMEDTQHLIHSNQCSGCRIKHIIGIRFKCQVCRDLSLCLPCFAAGFAGSKHEASHRMCEVFVEDQPPQRWTHFLARLCGCFEYAQKTQRANSEEEERRGFCNAHESGTAAGQSHAGTELCAIPAETRSIRENSRLRQLPAAVTAIATQAHQQELCSLTGLATTASKASERLQSIIDRLLLQNEKLEAQLLLLATTSSAEISDFLSAHQTFLLQIIEDMRQLSRISTTPVAPLTSSTFLTSSTPQRVVTAAASLPVNWPPGNHVYDAYGSVGANLTHSINGADLNRSYLEANKSDYSLSDLSLWFDQRRSSMAHGTTPASLPLPLSTVLTQSLEVRDSEMTNFKLLLHKVKEIVEDSYSDNAELSVATQNLENVLDSIIKSEEQQRHCST